MPDIEIHGMHEVALNRLVREAFADAPYAADIDVIDACTVAKSAAGNHHRKFIRVCARAQTWEFLGEDIRARLALLGLGIEFQAIEYYPPNGGDK